MGKTKAMPLEELRQLLKTMKKTKLTQYLKSHHLLRPCSQDRPDEWPEIGTLVWAKSDGSVFWPAFIASVKDRNIKVEGGDDIDDSAYRFVIFLEKDFRYAPIKWSHIIPVKEPEIQKIMFPYYNKFVVKKTWRPTTGYKKSLQLFKDFLGIPAGERQDKVESLYEAQPKLTKAPKHSTQIVVKQETVIITTAAIAEAEKRRQDGLRVSERNIHKIIAKGKESQLQETAITKTDSPTVKKQVIHPSKNRASARPVVGGEVLKQWVKEKFEGVDKQFVFEPNPLRCYACRMELDSNAEVKQCHGFPHHVECLIKLDGDTPHFKCKMCLEKQCCLCKKHEHVGVDSETEDEPTTTKQQGKDDVMRPIKCSRCDLRFHLKCLEKWPQAEIQGKHGPIVCPSHFCHTCLGEQRINNQMRDYTAIPSKSLRCSLCLSTYHRQCIPAGCGEHVEGNNYIVCPTHKVPDLKVSQRRIGCLNCHKRMTTSDTRVECTMCIQIFHPECVGYVGKDKEKYTLEKFGKTYKCVYCTWGLFPVYGQVVWFQQSLSQYWPARILYPKEFRNRNSFATRLPGQFSIEYFGSTSFFDKASRVIPLHLTTVEIFKSMKIYQEFPKILRAHEEAAFCESFGQEFRTKSLPKPKPIYKEIKRNYYRNNKSFSVERNFKTDAHEGMCSCSESKAKEVCVSDSGCHNRDTEMECSDKTCGAGERCTNRMFSRRENDEDFLKLELTKNKGWGIRAVVQFKRGDFVGEYRGEVIGAEEKTRRLERKVEEDPLYILEIAKGLCIDAEYMGSLSRFINHSCDPNCELRRYASAKGKAVGGIFALRHIEVGEEVTFDYAYGNESNAPFRCHCGARKCRFFIGKPVPDEFDMDTDTDEDGDQWDDVCSHCDIGGRVICCEFPGCKKVFHYHCVGITRAPRKDWCCAAHSEADVKKNMSRNQKPTKAKPKSQTPRKQVKTSAQSATLSISKSSKLSTKSQKISEAKIMQPKVVIRAITLTPPPLSMQRHSTASESDLSSPNRKRKLGEPISDSPQKKQRIAKVETSKPIMKTPTSARKQYPAHKNLLKPKEIDAALNGIILPPPTTTSIVLLETPDKRQGGKRKLEDPDINLLKEPTLFPDRLSRRRNSIQLPAKISQATRTKSSPTELDGENKRNHRGMSLQREILQPRTTSLLHPEPGHRPRLQPGPASLPGSFLQEPRSTRARSLRIQTPTKGSGPFSPLALNSILMGPPPPVFLTDSLVPSTTDKNSEVTVGIRPRTSPRNPTPQLYQMNPSSDLSGSFPSSTTTVPALHAVNEVKSELLKLEKETSKSSSVKASKKKRFFDQNTDGKDNSFTSEITYVVENDTELEIISDDTDKVESGHTGSVDSA